MAKYLEIRNGNNKVIIDDSKRVAKFLYRGSFKGRSDQSLSYFLTDGDNFAYNTSFMIHQNVSLASLGFSPGQSRDKINGELMVFARSSGGKAFRVKSYFTVSAADNSKVTLSVFLGTDTAGLDIEICLYTIADMVPCKMGSQAFNAQREIVFDSMRGYMQTVGAIYGSVNVRADPAATYTLNIPAGLDSKNLFISQRSALPFFSAYNIHSGGVRYGQTYFFPVMSFPNSTSLVVQLRRQNYVAGDNSTTSFAGFFENVIYCPYPSGVWISGL